MALLEKMMTTIEKPKPVGRLSRLLEGISLLGSSLLSLRKGAFTLFLVSLGVAAGLLVFYLLAHLLVVKFFPTINLWVGAITANLPAEFVFLIGSPRGVIFGQGEGFLGAALYVGVSCCSPHCERTLAERS